MKMSRGARLGGADRVAGREVHRVRAGRREDLAPIGLLHSLRKRAAPEASREQEAASLRLTADTLHSTEAFYLFDFLNLLSSRCDSLRIAIHPHSKCIYFLSMFYFICSFISFSRIHICQLHSSQS